MMMRLDPADPGLPSTVAVGGEEQGNFKRVADRYLKREVLGEGTYGVVFKAVDTKVGL